MDMMAMDVAIITAILGLGARTLPSALKSLVGDDPPRKVHGVGDCCARLQIFANASVELREDRCHQTGAIGTGCWWAMRPQLVHRQGLKQEQLNASLR